MSEPKTWTVEKRIPITLVCLIIAQVIGLVWVASNTQARLTHVEEQQEKAEAVIQTIPDRLTRLETLMERMIANMDRR